MFLAPTPKLPTALSYLETDDQFFRKITNKQHFAKFVNVRRQFKIISKKLGDLPSHLAFKSSSINVSKRYPCSLSNLVHDRPRSKRQTSTLYFSLSCFPLCSIISVLEFLLIKVCQLCYSLLFKFKTSLSLFCCVGCYAAWW